jgi:hypothetical protein
LDSVVVADVDVDSLDELDPEEASEVLPSEVDFVEVESFEEDLASPLSDDEDDDRESVMYQPLPLKTMPTGWMTFRSAPPHCSQVVSGGSEKLWRFSIRSSQAVHL